MEKNGVRPGGAPWESYITDPADHPDQVSQRGGRDGVDRADEHVQRLGDRLDRGSEGLSEVLRG